MKVVPLSPHISFIPFIPLILGVASSTTVVAAVTTPFVDRFESVAQDASITGIPYVSNSWGLHQPRITRHSDGSIRVLYLNTDSSTNVIWHVMLRDNAGQWSQEASGISTDDVVLMRDARNDRAYVLAWPSSVPTIYASPSYTTSQIPGSWQVLGSTARHYGNAGISSDGTVCLKASREFSTLPLTSITNTEYACGSFSTSSETWNWSVLVPHNIGRRYAYDYIFPNPSGLASGSMYAASSSDLHKDASDVPNLDPGWGNYVFDGIRFYSTALNSDATWANTDNKISADAAEAWAAATGSKVQAPTMRLHESFIDSRGRIFAGYFAEDPSDSSVRGMYMAVTNSSGSMLFQAKWPRVPTFGATRIFEDSQNRLWLLWNGQGSRSTNVWLYPIIETTNGGVTTFTTGAYTDISASFNPYSIQGSLYLAVPRGGNDKSLFVDAIYNTCWTTYQSGVNFDSSKCYNSDRSGRQRVFYTRIRLPD